MRRLLVVCCAVVFLDAAFFAALAPLLPSLSHEFELSSTETGILSGSYAAGVLILAIPGGWFAARHGARTAVLAGLVGMGVFSPIFGVADSLWLLDSSRFMQGASGALMWAGAMSWVISSGSAERRGALVGTLVAAATVGELLGAPIGALAHSIGMQVVFGLVGIVSLVLLISAYLMQPPARGSARAIGPALRAARGSALFPSLWLLGAAAIAFGVAVVMGPLRLDSLGGGATLIAAAFACGSIVETIIGPQIGHLSDRIGRARPYRIGAALGAAAIVAIAVIDSRALVFASIVFFAFGAGLAFTPSMALAADAASRAGLDQGYASGLTNVAFGGGQMVGAIGAGALAGAGYLLPALLTAAALLSAAALAGRIIARDKAAEAALGSAP